MTLISSLLTDNGKYFMVNLPLISGGPSGLPRNLWLLAWLVFWGLVSYSRTFLPAIMILSLLKTNNLVALSLKYRRHRLFIFCTPSTLLALEAFTTALQTSKGVIEAIPMSESLMNKGGAECTTVLMAEFRLQRAVYGDYPSQASIPVTERNTVSS